jgi:hypothetical protein
MNYQHNKGHEINAQRTRRSATALIQFNTVPITASSKFQKHRQEQIREDNPGNPQRTNNTQELHQKPIYPDIDILVCTKGRQSSQEPKVIQENNSIPSRHHSKNNTPALKNSKIGIPPS